MRQLKSLFQPIRLGSVELDNRIVMASMNTHFCPEGRINEQLKSYYAERARGGAALIVCRISSFLAKGRIVGIAIDKDEYIPGLRELSNVIHDCGAKTFAQLAARQVWAKHEGAQPESVGASAVPPPLPGGASSPKSGLRSSSAPLRGSRPASAPRELTIEEIEQIVEEKGEEARRAREAGFDGIELHANVGGSLTSRFISPLTNQRTDRYGGSVENRYRFLLEILASSRKKVGNDFPIICRISGADFLEGGNTLDNSKIGATLLEKAGVDALNVTTGWHEAPVAFFQMGVPPGAFVYLAEEVKKVVSIPVIGGTKIFTPLLADQLIADGRVDLVYMVRALIADPELPNKAQEGRFDDVRPCIACCHCFDETESDRPLVCAVNARVGRELDYPVYQPSQIKKKVVVVGGGPAGMEAARVAAIRGHEVTLYDKGPKLGGALLLAEIVNDELERLLKYMKREISKLPIQVKTGQELTPELVDRTKPDVLILATGGASAEIGRTLPSNVITSREILNTLHAQAQNRDGIMKRMLWRGASIVLRYFYKPSLLRWLLKFNFPFGKRVTVIGGGFAGCELADFLADRGKKVNIIGESTRVGNGVGPSIRWVFRMRLREKNVKMIERAEVKDIVAKGVKVSGADFTEFIESDTVALARELSPSQELEDKLKGRVPVIYRIGDCAEPAQVRQAIASGFLTGMEI
ncbi:FAD-dependent oxidoreductase [Chloroflexota bacterium]